MMGWHNVIDLDERIALRGRLFARLTPAQVTRLLGVTLSACRVAHWPNVQVVRVQAGTQQFLAFVGPDFVRFVAGEPRDFFETNLRQSAKLDTVKEINSYLVLYCGIVMGARGMGLVEQASDIAWQATPDAATLAAARISPILLAAGDRHGRHDVTLCLQGPQGLVRQSLVLWPEGLVQERAVEPILAHPALALPAPLLPFSSLAMLATAGEDEAARLAAIAALSGTFDDAAASGDDAIASGDSPAAPEPAPPRVDRRDNFYESDEDEAPSLPPTTLAQSFATLAEILFDQALARHADLPGRAQARIGAFIDYVATHRPTIAIETPYRDLREDFAELIGRRCNLRVESSWMTQNGSRVAPRAACAVLMTEATFATQSDTPDNDASLMLAPIIRGPHVAVFVVDRVDSLPLPARDMIDFTLAVPRLDTPGFAAVISALFGAKPRLRGHDWVRYVLPRDIARARAVAGGAKAFIAELDRTITRRLRQYSSPDGEVPSLAELHGLGEARQRMEELAAEIHAARRGEIGWDMVDRGYLLVGPPGTGKTTLVKALARECGIRFVLASASRWQEGTSLGPHIQNMRRSFREARLYAPAILFIDEIDSIGARARVEERNSQYQTVVINTLLEELQGFEGRDGVIVIGATNNVENVDPALRRPGRLDRTIVVPYPNVAALAQIFRVYLKRAERRGFATNGIDLERLAKLSFGRTGAHVELYVRGAQRRARRAGRKAILEADLMDEIINMPPDGLRAVLPPDAMQRVAVHEAGHALTNLLGPRQGQGLSWVSITPRADGSLGFVAQLPDQRLCLTEADMEEEIRIVLGGRAAEEIVFGRQAVSGGAGGDAASDLAMASGLTLRMLTQFGFSKAGGLLWVVWDGQGNGEQVTAQAIRNLPLGEDLLAEARTTLDRLYNEVLARLAAQRARLDGATALLVARQDVPAEEFAHVG